MIMPTDEVEDVLEVPDLRHLLEPRWVGAEAATKLSPAVLTDCCCRYHVLQGQPLCWKQ